MQKITDETKKKVVKLHIQDGRTIAKLASEYGVCNAPVSNRIRAYREEGQTNNAAKSEYELMGRSINIVKNLQKRKKKMTS